MTSTMNVTFIKIAENLRARLVPGKKNLGSFTTLIRSIKYRLIIKLITWMDGKSRGESIKPN